MRITPNGIVVIKGPATDNLVNQPSGTTYLDTIVSGNGNGILILGYSDDVGSDPKMVLNQNTIQVKKDDGTIDDDDSELYINPLGGNVILGKAGDITGGYVGIATNSPLCGLHVIGATSDGVDYAGVTIDSDNVTHHPALQLRAGPNTPSVPSTPSTRWIELCDGDGDTIAEVANDSSSPFAQFYAGSDSRIKTDIKIADIDSLTKLCNIPLKSYKKLKPNGNVSAVCDMGFIAQDVELEFPRMVGENTVRGWDFPVKCMGINGFIPHLVKAVQQLKQENNALKARIEALES